MYVSVITGKENVSKGWNCIISMFLTSFIIYFVFDYALRGRTKGRKGNTIPLASNHSGVRTMTEGGAKKSQQCHKYFL